MRYWPNPAHKRGTTEAGPPRWWPDKEPCPDDLTIDERNDLLATSLALDPADAHSRRFNVRRCVRGLELYEAKWTRDVDGEPEFHGHPTSFVPARVLRGLRDCGRITASEYRKLVKRFGCP
jgi:hypothetical protein